MHKKFTKEKEAEAWLTKQQGEKWVGELKQGGYIAILL